MTVSDGIKGNLSVRKRSKQRDKNQSLSAHNKDYVKYYYFNK